MESRTLCRYGRGRRPGPKPQSLRTSRPFVRGGRFIDGQLGRGLTEAPGEPGQPEDAERQPGQSNELGRAIQVEKQVEVYRRPGERDDYPSEDRAGAASRTVAHEVGDHAQVD